MHVHWFWMVDTRACDCGCEAGVIYVRRCRCGEERATVDHTYGTSGW
jgi:hypothetical protein